MNFNELRARAARLATVRALNTSLPVSVAVVGAVFLGLAVWAFLGEALAPLLAAAIVGPVAAVALYRRSVRSSLDARRLALTDRLTGLGHDRSFLEQLDAILDRDGGESHCLTLCLVDIDDFKRINDRFGHPVGDRVLAQVAGCLRSDGEAFRIGGDEFALLLPGQGEEAGLAVANAVLDRISALEYGHGRRVTASAGLVVFPQHTPEHGELVRLADRALYWAKSEGKDCARVYHQDLEESHESWMLTGETMRAALRGVRMSAAGNLAARVAVRMGLTNEHVELIRVAGSLNDIGKVALPDELISKPGPLTEEERTALERHPRIGYRILESLGIDPVATWVLYHHERWDGRGYPDRLSGERIPLAARILFAADAYEAMTTDQAWRPRLSDEEALAELDRCAGTQFDPEVVSAFVAELRTAPAVKA
jgi:diguanylate cyclase (GGDEF)-like protein